MKYDYRDIKKSYFDVQLFENGNLMDKFNENVVAFDKNKIIYRSNLIDFKINEDADYAIQLTTFNKSGDILTTTIYFRLKLICGKQNKEFSQILYKQQID